MQGNEKKDNDERKDGEVGCKKKGNGAAAAASADSRDEATEDGDEEESSNMIIVPTKTEDGGSTITNQVRQYTNNNNQDQGQETTSTRPNAFQTNSDNDTRMLSLLGVEAAGRNPNEGEREDWRQLTGFTGIGEERRCSNDVGTPRRTRLSFELHHNAFENMWIERGELNLDDVAGQQQDGNLEDGQQQQQQHGHQDG
eukprot:scaffold33574_cov152-Skeletonema_marinoi.AAC.4